MFKAPKYGQKKVQYENKSFASKLELALFHHLKELEKSGLISDLQTQVNVKLTKAGIVYIPDFSFEESGKTVYAEAKGFETDVWRIKRRLWRHYGPGELRIYKGSYERMRLEETIIPKVEK